MVRVPSVSPDFDREVPVLSKSNCKMSFTPLPYFLLFTRAKLLNPLTFFLYIYFKRKLYTTSVDKITCMVEYKNDSLQSYCHLLQAQGWIPPISVALCYEDCWLSCPHEASHCPMLLCVKGRSVPMLCSLAALILQSMPIPQVSHVSRLLHSLTIDSC